MKNQSVPPSLCAREECISWPVGIVKRCSLLPLLLLGRGLEGVFTLSTYNPFPRDITSSCMNLQ